MPAIRDFAQNLSTSTTLGLVCSSPDVAQNDLLIAMVTHRGNVAAPIYDTVGEAADKCWLWSASGGWTDYTSQFNNATTGDFYLTYSTAALNDLFYFGKSTMFNGIEVVISTLGAGTQTWILEYWNGAAWTTLTTKVNGIILTATVGNHSASFDVPTDWATYLVNGTTYYWVRIRISVYTSQTTRPVYSIGHLGTFNQLNSMANSTTANHSINWKIAGASEPAEYGVSDQQTAVRQKMAMIASIRDVDTVIPLVHTTEIGRAHV